MHKTEYTDLFLVQSTPVYVKYYVLYDIVQQGAIIIMIRWICLNFTIKISKQLYIRQL
jgi:hypothetical protein